MLLWVNLGETTFVHLNIIRVAKETWLFRAFLLRLPVGRGGVLGYIVMLRARMFRSLIIRTGIKERNIRARNITI